MSNSDVKTAEMLKSGVHFGYSRSSRHPKMKPFIFTTRNSVEIFDLEKVLARLDAAKEFLKNLGKEKKIVVFVATKKGIREIVESAAKEISMPYVKERWLGGTLTNFKEIKSRIDFLNDLLKKRESKELEKYTKKERLQIDRKIAKLEKYLSGLKQCAEKPAAMITVDSAHEKIAIEEARQRGVVTIVLMNSDCDPEDADFSIPGNDSSISSVSFFIKELVNAYKEGLAASQQEK
ncbi:MAG: small subunit ribosomal protein S2 [Parcubacteria group bacterium Athens0714_24]|nr:MAG: small subunit ribosomal protein S2 [Parcubacteria group bacterium Athens0714_24]